MKQDQRFKRGNRVSRRAFIRNKGCLQQLKSTPCKSYRAFLRLRNRTKKNPIYLRLVYRLYRLKAILVKQYGRKYAKKIGY